MFKKIVGDVRHGYVESAWGTFEILGDRDKTLAALKEGFNRSRENQTLEPTILPEANYVPFNTIHGVGMVAIKHTN